MKTEFVVRVWDLEAKKLLFEASSDAIAQEIVIDTLRLDRADPDLWGGEYEATPEQGREILRLMGKDYTGPGSYRISCEQAPTVTHSSG